jgi:hypothetical protein
MFWRVSFNGMSTFQFDKYAYISGEDWQQSRESHAICSKKLERRLTLQSHANAVALDLGIQKSAPKIGPTLCANPVRYGQC